MKNIFYIKIALLFLSVAFSGCELDDRLDDLTGSYEGKFVDKNTNEVVCTEYYGAKLRLLDLAYGKIAQPLDYFALPDGTFKNTKIFPAEYKVWADGPFLTLDTIQKMDLTSTKTFDIRVVPNISLKVTEVKNIFGIGMKITYSYKVNDPLSTKQEIGFVYSNTKYPGLIKNTGVKKYLNDITDLEGTITKLVYLEPNKSYFVRATGKFIDKGDYWNYSKQEVFKTTNVDVVAIPLEVKVGTRSSSSAVFQIELPTIEDLNYKLEYTDKDGTAISETLTGADVAYAANLSKNTTTNVNVSLINDGIQGNPVAVAVRTKADTDRYIEGNPARPENVPFYNDLYFKYSLSKYTAEDLGPAKDVGWVTSPSRHVFIDWWGTWLYGFGKDNLPTSTYLSGITEFTLYGNVKTLVDILPFTGLQTLTINKVEDFFKDKDEDETVSKDLNLEPLKKLSNLTKVIIGVDVPLTEADFTDAGITALTIVKN